MLWTFRKCGQTSTANEENSLMRKLQKTKTIQKRRNIPSCPNGERFLMEIMKSNKRKV